MRTAAHASSTYALVPRRLEVTEWIDGGASGEGGGRQWKLRNAMFDVVLLVSAGGVRGNGGVKPQGRSRGQRIAMLATVGREVIIRTGARPNAQYDLSQNGCNMKCSDRSGVNEEPSNIATSSAGHLAVVDFTRFD